MSSKNSKLQSVWSTVRSRVENGRGALRSFKPDRSLGALWTEGKSSANRLSRTAKRQFHQISTQTSKRFARVKRDAGAQAERLQTRLMEAVSFATKPQLRIIEAVGIATKPQLDELDHRISKLAKKLNSLASTTASASDAPRT